MSLIEQCDWHTRSGRPVRDLRPDADGNLVGYVGMARRIWSSTGEHLTERDLDLVPRPKGNPIPNPPSLEWEASLPPSPPAGRSGTDEDALMREWANCDPGPIEEKAKEMTLEEATIKEGSTMFSNLRDKSGEPSMEDILASIRRILTEDEDEELQKRGITHKELQHESLNTLLKKVFTHMLKEPVTKLDVNDEVFHEVATLLGRKDIQDMLQWAWNPQYFTEAESVTTLRKENGELRKALGEIRSEVDRVRKISKDLEKIAGSVLTSIEGDTTGD